MPRIITPEPIEVYTLAELKELHPDGYAKVLARWESYADSDTPWQAETMDSLKAVFKAFDCRMTDWNLGPHNRSNMIRASVPDLEYESGELDADGYPIFLEEAEAEKAFVTARLQELGYTKNAEGVFTFPGLCPLTGYCCDEDVLEAVAKAVLIDGESLKDAMEGLESVMARMMEADADLWRDEESMETNWSDNEYTADGEEM